MKKIKGYYNTVKFLKPIQIRYRLYYALRSRWHKLIGHKTKFDHQPKHVQSVEIIPFNFVNAVKGKDFHFLHQSKSFDKIDWDYYEFGQLWVLNLNYFDYLNHNSDDTDVTNDLELIRDYMSDIEHRKIGSFAYSTSLRVMNWIKFCSHNNITDKDVNSSLYSQCIYLSKNLEFHILGNHLLENAVALLFAAYYFQEDRFYKKALNILEQQLKEQTLKDGAHFELSPMYHKIILYRVLECIQVIEKNKYKGEVKNDLVPFLKEKAAMMYGWLDEITFHNGELPMVNDAAHGIAPPRTLIDDYCRHLDITPTPTEIKASGYRKKIIRDFEWLVDVGNMGPDYQPGHAHCDTLNTLLHYKGVPYLVDVGVSTYNENERRILERGTSSHNTTQLGTINQSHIWKKFRLGNRAKCTILSESDMQLSAQHDGYQQHGCKAKRSWQWTEIGCTINDEMQGANQPCFARWHIHPDRKIEKIDNNKILVDGLLFTFDGHNDITVNEYDLCVGYNQFKKASKLEVIFEHRLATTIEVQP